MLADKLDEINNLIGGGLVRKFVIWILVIIILLGVLTTVFVQLSLTNTLSADLRERGAVISRNLATSSVESILLEDTVSLHRLVDKFKKVENDVTYIYITDEKGKVLTHTFEDGFPTDLLTTHKDTSRDASLVDIGDSLVIDFRAPILDGKVGFVHIGMDETSMRTKVAGTINLIITLTLIVGVVGVLMAYVAGNYLIGPIRALVKGTEEIGRGNLGYQIEPRSTDEIHILSKAFNQMSYNLSRSINELRTSEERYKKLVDGISDAVILVDSQKHVLSWNSAAEKIFGYSSEEIAGRKITMLYSASEGGSIDNGGDLLDGEGRFVKKNGQSFSGVAKSKPLPMGADMGEVIVISDITERKEMEKLEKQLIQADKLATIGQLAAGVAHEINNPLANISLYTQMLLKKKDTAMGEKLKVINEEADRAASIAKGLLEFARQSEPKLSPIDVNMEIERVLTILRPELGGIRVVTNLEPLPKILADSDQIRQVLINMLTNSIQAIVEQGELTVKTSAKNDFIEISISDNGCGIPPENLNKIFDPFFTTKATGEGTGLGLSICYGFIKRHNGSIDVESKVGVGTTFTVKLPIRP